MAEKNKACVIGSPIEHSLSPVIHNAAYDHLKLNWFYDRHEVDETNFNEGVEELIQQDYVAFNVTMPGKEAAHNYCDITYGGASRLYSVNTIVVKNGKTHGYSTDGDGFVNFLKDENIDLSSNHFVIIGSGGAARSICDALFENGARISICARNLEKANEIIDTIKNAERDITNPHSSINAYELKNADELISNADVLINATPIGMHIDKEIEFDSPINLELLNSDQIVIDTIYSPLETPLLNKAKSLGCPVYNGIYMLLYQAALSFELMTGQKAPINIMRKALLEEINNRF